MTLAKNYAKSLFQSIENSSEGKKSEDNSFDYSLVVKTAKNENSENYETLYEQLKLVSSFVDFSPEIFKTFSNPISLESEKLNTLFHIFPGLSKKMNSFLRILAEKKKLVLLPEITKEYQKFLNNSKKVITIKLIVAGNLNPKFGLKYLKLFRELTFATNIILEIEYNSKILGGFILEYNSFSIDASVLRELESIII